MIKYPGLSAFFTLVTIFGVIAYFDAIAENDLIGAVLGGACSIFGLGLVLFLALDDDF